jgi:hypothetical protein
VNEHENLIGKEWSEQVRLLIVASKWEIFRLGHLYNEHTDILQSLHPNLDGTSIRASIRRAVLKLYKEGKVAPQSYTKTKRRRQVDWWAVTDDIHSDR